MKKQMPMKTNFLLATFLVFLGGFAYWYEFKGKSAREKEKESKTKLMALDSAQEFDVLRVVDSASNRDFEMRCRAHCKQGDFNASWEITVPIAFRADEGNVHSFVSSLLNATVQDTLPLDEAKKDQMLGEFGLDAARRDSRRVELRLRGKETPYVFYLGEDTAVGGNLYLYVPALDGKNVKIVPGFLKESLQKNLNHWRMKRLLPDIQAHDIAGLQLRQSASSVELSKKEGTWFVGSEEADTQTVQTYFMGVAFLQAKEYVSEDKASFKFVGKPRYELTIKLTDNRPGEKVLVYQGAEKTAKPIVVLESKRFVAELDSSSFEKLTKTADFFRSRELIRRSQAQQIKSIEVVFRGSKQKQVLKAEPALLAKFKEARISEFAKGLQAPKSFREESNWVFLGDGGLKIREFTVYGDAEQKQRFVVAKKPKHEAYLLEKGDGLPGKAEDAK